MKKQEQPRLTVELVPSTCWGKNVRSILSNDTWQALRNRRLERTRICSVCKSKKHSNELHLHEVWHYDDNGKIQTLKSLVLLCQSCHDVKHIGRATKVGDGKSATDHLCLINGWSRKKADNYIQSKMKQWRERSKHEWTLNVNHLKKYVPPTRIHLDWLETRFSFPSNPVDARAWAQEMLQSNALVLDTETTGLLKHLRSEIIQISILTMAGKVLVEQKIKPKYRIPKRTIKINKITNEMVKECPSFREVFGSINAALDGNTVIAYNVKFDKPMLQKTCDIYRLEPPECRWHCAMWAYYIYNGSSGRFRRLPNATHDSTEDCRAVLNLFRKMAAGEGQYYGHIDL